MGAEGFVVEPDDAALGRREAHEHVVFTQFARARRERAQREGAGYGGRELPGLPGSVVSVFGAPGATGFAKLAADVEVEMPIGWVAVGQDSLPIEVLGDAQR